MYLDANILLEILLGRAHSARAREFIESQNGELFISTLTAHLVVHFGTSIVQMRVLRSFLSDYTVLSLDAADFEWAFTNARNSDFEDALQLGVAIRNGCETFVTFDQKLATSYHDLMRIKVTLLT